MTGSEFDFEVYEYDPATQTVVGNMVASGSNDADGKVRFSTITYTHEQMSGAVKNEQTTNVSPSANYKITAGDIMVVLGDNKALEAVQKL